MKCITICQPWAEMIARGLKVVENRTWPTRYRGPLAIHAGKGRKFLASEDRAAWPGRYGVPFPAEESMAFGAIVAVAELVDCVPIDEPNLFFDLAGHPFTEGPYCWILQDVRRVGPIACNGALQLWTPPPVILKQLQLSVASTTPNLAASA